MTPLSTTTQKVSPKVINLSNIFFTKHEIETLKLGLSFTPTPKHNISELETDIYHFIRKLCLTYHFHDSTYEEKSIVKNQSKFTPKNNENQELETICKNLPETLKDVIFSFVKLTAIFILNKLKTSNKELLNINQM